MSFNLLVCGALIRPLTLKEDLAGPGDPSGSCLGKLSTLFGLPLLSHWPFMRFVLAVTLINTGYFIPYVHLVARARELGFDEYQAAFLMSVAAVADLSGRLLSGWLADCRAFHLGHILVAWTSLTGISLALVPLGRSYPLLMAIGVCYGFFSGALTPVVFSILPEIVGIGRIFGSMGLLQMMESIGGLLGAPFSGWLRDMTGNYTASFLAAGAFLLAGSLVLVTLPNFFSCLRSSSPACTQLEAGTEPAPLTLASGKHSSQDRDCPARSQDLGKPT
ncbi:monocarboxylate transporter 13-like [Chelonoidis abingdonii]|uniref:monocarboxylate transporter 13-like n=1 Tax=Chelonoidis abingdonii TaxID=106734 RepID=UPI003F49B0C3